VIEMKRIAACIPLALVAGGMLRAQDGGGVQVSPPYAPGNEHLPSSAPPMHVGVESCPRDVRVAPRMFGPNAAGSVPRAFFRSADPSGIGTIRYNINLRVTEERDEEDPATYYETPDVNVTGRSGDFRFSSTFARTYRTRQRHGTPQDEADRPPIPGTVTPQARGASWLTGGGPMGKAFLSLDLSLKGRDFGGAAVDEVSAGDLVIGGGVQLSLWGGILRAGLSYLGGRIRTDSLTACQAPTPPHKGSEYYFFPAEPPTCPPVRVSGSISIWELDLTLGVLQGAIDIGDGCRLYSQLGPTVALEYMQLEIGGWSGDGWVISGGAFLECGVRSGRLRVFGRASASWGLGVGGIRGSSGLTLFSGVEFDF
jgi:hypothetical protein